MQLRKTSMAKPNLYEKQAEFARVEPRARTRKVRNADSAPSRVGKVGVTLYFHEDVHRMFKELVMDEAVPSITALLMEGANLALQKYGKKPIA